MLTVTKQYRDFPAAHRAPQHDGHCRLIHGHNFGFDLVFTAQELDINGFVIDVGKLGVVKEFLVDKFDHTLLLNDDDPQLDYFRKTLNFGTCFAKIIVVPNCGMEGLAEYVMRQVRELLKEYFFRDYVDRELRIVSVTCWEDSKNSSTYTDSE